MHCDFTADRWYLVSLASFQYLCRKRNAALFGCLWRLKIPFLFPITLIGAKNKAEDVSGDFWWVHAEHEIEIASYSQGFLLWSGHLMG